MILPLLKGQKVALKTRGMEENVSHRNVKAAGNLFKENEILKSRLQIAVDNFEAIEGYAGTRRQKVMRDLARDALAKIREPK